MTGENVSTQTMAGKVAIVTGGNSGIGYETVAAFAARGARVAMVGRDAARTEAAAHRIRTRQPDAQVDVLIADLADLAQVRRLAADILSRYHRLDVLVNNAGLMFDRTQRTSDGLEATFAINYFAPFLLTNLLLDRLKASAPSRIVNVASDAHFGGHIPWDDLAGRERGSGWRAYADSKLALVMFTRELARRLAGTGVTVNAVHPGVVATGFAQEPGNLSGLFFKLGKPFLRTPARGAQTTIFVATAPEGGTISGAYFVDKRSRRMNKLALDDADCAHLWDLTAQIVGLTSAPTSGPASVPMTSAE